MDGDVFVRVENQRPDSRLFLSFLWTSERNVDSCGNCDPNNPADRTWTKLYMRDREGTEEMFEIWDANTDPLVLQVTGSSPEMAARAAILLALETNGTWAESNDTNAVGQDPMALAEKLGEDFDLQAAIRRAEHSVWRHATLENPYPNWSS